MTVTTGSLKMAIFVKVRLLCENGESADAIAFLKEHGNIMSNSNPSPPLSNNPRLKTSNLF